jgi:hypothetical protein
LAVAAPIPLTVCNSVKEAVLISTVLAEDFFGFFGPEEDGLGEELGSVFILGEGEPPPIGSVVEVGEGEPLPIGSVVEVGEGEPLPIGSVVEVGEGEPLPIGSVVEVGEGEPLPIGSVVVPLGVVAGEDGTLGIAVASAAGEPVPVVPPAEGMAILLGIERSAELPGLGVPARAGIAKINPSTPAKVMKVFGEVIRRIPLKIGLHNSII